MTRTHTITILTALSALCGIFAFVMILILPIFAHAAVSSVSTLSTSSTACTNTYSQTQPVPGGVGAAYDLFSLGHELLIQGSTCDAKNIVVTVGSGKTNQYIYGTAMYWDGKMWNNVALRSTHPVGVWHVGNAYASIPSTARETQVIAYICEQVAGAWKCGCHDNACAQAFWQSQTIVRPSVTSDTSSNTTSNTSSGGKIDARMWLMGYWVDFQSSSFPASQIDYDHLTHIVVGRVLPNADGTVTAQDEQDAKNIARQAHKHNVKALLWIGGSDSNDVWKQAASDENRKTFARNLVDLMDELGYDGLDLDWEPIDAEDHDAVLALVKELRKRDASMLITLPVDWVRSNSKDQTSNLAFLSDVSDYVDRIFIMTYSMTGPWSGWQSWFNSPLYGETTKTPNSIDSSVAAYKKAGVPTKKLGFGVGLYGRCFVPPVTGPRMDIPTTYTWSVTSLPYSTVLDVLKDSEAKSAWDSTARVPYVYRPTSTKTTTYCSYITYDDERSILEKAKYLYTNNLGGLILWTLGSGYLPDASTRDRQPLLQAAYQGVVEKKW